jgi:biotin transporter BioY
MVDFNVWDVLYPGTWVIFGVIGLPIYTAVLGWFLGKPRTPKKALMALSYLIGFIVSMWVGVYILTILIGIVFPPAM